MGTSAQLAVTAAAAEVARRGGGKIGESLAGDRKLTVHVGDNTRDVIAEATRIAEGLSKSAIETAFRNLDSDFLAPVEARSNDVLAALEDFKTTLNRKVRPA